MAFLRDLSCLATDATLCVRRTVVRRSPLVRSTLGGWRDGERGPHLHMFSLGEICQLLGNPFYTWSFSQRKEYFVLYISKFPPP